VAAEADRIVVQKLWSKRTDIEEGRGIAPSRLFTPEELGVETNTCGAVEQGVTQMKFVAPFFLRSFAALGRLGAC
jgi:hypothetical protein